MKQFLVGFFTWNVLLLLIVVAGIFWRWLTHTNRKIQESVADRDGQWMRALSYEDQGEEFEEDPLIAHCRRRHAEAMTGELFQRVRAVALKTGNERGLALWKAVKRNVLDGIAS